ncbi:hypothetical protein [Amycolatopsis sp. NPDC006125]|uniref:hypothetical protein n=1 Tax=Amycolatopsis sp. NPDC006125 TaxID=3156730 RepID=UPI0033BD316B
MRGKRFDPLGQLLVITFLGPLTAAVIVVVVTAALGGFLFLNTLYLQNVRGFSALHGLLTLPMAACA